MMTTIAVIFTVLFATLLSLKTKRKVAAWVYVGSCLVLMPLLAYTFEGLRVTLSGMSVGQVFSDIAFSTKSMFTAPFAYGSETFNPALAFLGSTTSLALGVASVTLAKTITETHKREKTTERYE